MQDNTKIIPLLKSSDLEASPIRWWNRSQSTNRKSNTINFGETRIVWNDKNIILNTTASPGATWALLNTTRDILTLLNMKGFEEFEFDSEAFYEQNWFYAEELIEE